MDYKNKEVIDESLCESETMVEGKSSRTLQKKGKTSLIRFRMKPSFEYSITDHGHFASRIYADSDADALRQYRQWYRQKYGKGKSKKDESLNECGNTINEDFEIIDDFSNLSPNVQENINKMKELGKYIARMVNEIFDNYEFKTLDEIKDQINSRYSKLDAEVMLSTTNSSAVFFSGDTFNKNNDLFKDGNYRSPVKANVDKDGNVAIYYMDGSHGSNWFYNTNSYRMAVSFGINVIFDMMTKTANLLYQKTMAKKNRKNDTDEVNESFAILDSHPLDTYNPEGKAKENFDHLLSISDMQRLDAALEKLFPDGCTEDQLNDLFENKSDEVEKLLVSGDLNSTSESLCEAAMIKDTENSDKLDMVNMVSSINDELKKEFDEAGIKCFLPDVQLYNNSIIMDVMPNDNYIVVRDNDSEDEAAGMNVYELIGLENDDLISEEDEDLKHATEILDEERETADKIIRKIASKYGFKKFKESIS